MTGHRQVARACLYIPQLHALVFAAARHLLAVGEKATDLTLYLRGEESAQDSTQAKEGN